LEALVISIARPGRLPPSEGRVFLDGDVDARDRRHRSIWPQLRDRRDEIAEIRTDIARQAKVEVMPPVQITTDAWIGRGPDECIHAGTGAISVERAMQIGVRLSGASALLADDLMLRQILLHQFSHCFWAARQVVGMGLPTARYLGFWMDCGMFGPESVDDIHLDNPEDWFGEDDVEIFESRARDLFPEGSDAVMREWVDAGLPCGRTPPLCHHADILIDEEIVERCRHLNSQDPPRPCFPRSTRR
jgi:hypothetical protein